MNELMILFSVLLAAVLGFQIYSLVVRKSAQKLVSDAEDKASNIMRSAEDKAENKIRAQILSVYFVIQLIGPAGGTALVGFPDPSGNLLFGIVSILISLSIVPLFLLMDLS